MTAYEMRISDWSSDVCSSDLFAPSPLRSNPTRTPTDNRSGVNPIQVAHRVGSHKKQLHSPVGAPSPLRSNPTRTPTDNRSGVNPTQVAHRVGSHKKQLHSPVGAHPVGDRSEEHTSELQSLMRISYAVFCLKKKTKQKTLNKHQYVQLHTYI